MGGLIQELLRRLRLQGPSLPRQGCVWWTTGIHLNSSTSVCITTIKLISPKTGGVLLLTEPQGDG